MSTGLDFEFLRLDPLNPPETRAQTKDEEDVFCQKLLLLGAKWFDSLSRYAYVHAVRDKRSGVLRSVLSDRGARVQPVESTAGYWYRSLRCALGFDQYYYSHPESSNTSDDIYRWGEFPSLAERSWIGTGIDPEKEGGFWLAEREGITYLVEGRRDLWPPENAAQLLLARTMQERCAMLQRMGAKFYARPADYHGVACAVNAWATKYTGEFEPLEQTWD